MNRNSRFALVLTVALAAAGVASFIVYRVVASIPVREVEVASLKAVVAARSIPVGTIVTKITSSWCRGRREPRARLVHRGRRVVNRGASSRWPRTSRSPSRSLPRSVRAAGCRRRFQRHAGDLGPHQRGDGRRGLRHSWDPRGRPRHREEGHTRTSRSRGRS